MNGFKIDDRVEVINDEEVFLKSGEIGKIIDFSKDGVCIQSETPTHGDGVWWTSISNIQHYNEKVETESESSKLKENFTEEDIKKPKRYNRKGKLECIDVIEDQEMDFIEGSILKYLWRYKDKGGTKDLEKIKEYVDLKIKFMQNERGIK